MCRWATAWDTYRNWNGHRAQRERRITGKLHFRVTVRHNKSNLKHATLTTSAPSSSTEYEVHINPDKELHSRRHYPARYLTWTCLRIYFFLWTTTTSSPSLSLYAWISWLAPVRLWAFAFDPAPAAPESCNIWSARKSPRKVDVPVISIVFTSSSTVMDSNISPCCSTAIVTD